MFAKELNYEFNPNRPVIVRHLGAYNLDLLAEYLRDNERMQEDVLDELSNCNITNAVIKFDCHLHDALRVAKIKKTRPGNNAPKIAMGKANEEFDNYLKSLKGESSESQEEALKKYQVARKRVTSSMCTIEHNKWKSLVDNNNSKKLWERIDWKGNLNKCEAVRPSDDELALHFEKLTFKGTNHARRKHFVVFC